MNKNNTVTEWRNYFEKSGNESSTYKIFIETAYGCHGSCNGCPIPAIQRNSKEPKWELDNLENTLNIFSNNLTNFRKDNNIKPIENLAITIGPAENLYFSENYLENLAKISKDFKNKLNVKNFHLAVSTSGLFAEKKLSNKIKAMKNVLDENELTFAFIINLRQFEKTPSHYYKFAEFIFEHVNLVELEINMDQNLGEISMENLQNFAKFVDSFPFIQLDFAYAINDGNVTQTFFKNQDFYNFIENIRILTNSPMKQYFSQWNENLKPVPLETLDFNENFQKSFNNITQNAIRLNSLGQWHFAKNILGTIYYDDTFGITNNVNYNENPFSNKNLNSFKKELANYFHKQLLSHIPCHECLWKNICLNSGFLTYTKFSDKKESMCTNPAFTIFEKKQNA
jgi:hypothetical protein